MLGVRRFNLVFIFLIIKGLIINDIVILRELYRVVIVVVVVRCLDGN